MYVATYICTYIYMQLYLYQVLKQVGIIKETITKKKVNYQRPTVSMQTPY